MNVQFNQLPALALTFSLLLSMANGALAKGQIHPIGSVSVVSIQQQLPENIKTVMAPDVDKHHYVTLNGTHFSYRCHVLYTLKTKQAAVEICEIAPVELKIISWPETEVINIVKGSVEIEEQDGSKKSFREGDMFVLPQGYKGIWRQTEVLHKVVVRHPIYWKD